MSGRDTGEQHRVSTPLELLFDLAFVVAISQAAAGLHHAVADYQVLVGLGTFAWVFFAIWWAWLNYSWFASAYDTGDIPFRLLTMLQMGGVLLLAVGVDDAFARPGHLVPTLIAGYVLMRVALVIQWLRAAAEDPARRSTCLRYGVGIALAQVFWVAALLTPAWAMVPVFLCGLVIELAVPVFAEGARVTRGAGRTPWHPHHIAERYALLTIIVLGEGVLGTTQALSSTLSAVGWTPEFAVVGAASAALVFGLWWAYFLTPYGDVLDRDRSRAMGFGVGHYLVFASLAAVGAGLAVTAEALAPDHHVSTTRAVTSIAAALALFFVTKFALHEFMLGRARAYRPVTVACVAVLAGIAWLAREGLPLAACLVLLAAVPAAMVAFAEFSARRAPAESMAQAAPPVP